MRLGNKQKKKKNSSTNTNGLLNQRMAFLIVSQRHRKASVTLNTAQILFYQQALMPDISVQQNIMYISHIS